MKITKWDIKFFFLGILVILLLEFVFNWSETISDFKEGFNDVYE